MDKISKEQRSRNMAAIRAKNTGPELIVRRALHEQGLRYRVHVNSLPGKPDIVFRGRKTAIFIHGCFWHMHKNCKYATMPKSNTTFWRNKLKGNVEKDRKNKKALKKEGYKVLVVWECEIKKIPIENIIRKIRKVLNEK